MGGRGIWLVGVCVALCAAIAAAPAGAATFSNKTPIRTLADLGDAGALLPYPSAVAVSGVQGTVTKATATLTDIAHGDIDELAALLVAPDGRKTILTNRSCDGQSTSASPVTFTFEDAASAPLPAEPPCPTGTYRPSDVDFGFYLFYYPAPQPPYPAALSAFTGAQPNGIWQLFVMDEAGAVGGSINGGWSLDLTTTGGPAAPPVKAKKCKKRKKRAAEAKKRCKKKRKP
jgi:subtilisin-like proprotein convertase family protein